MPDALSGGALGPIRHNSSLGKCLEVYQVRPTFRAPEKEEEVRMEGVGKVL